MGTTWSVKLVQNDSSDNEEGGGQTTALDASTIQARLDSVENAMSNWKSDSDVSKLNRMAAGCLLVTAHTEKVATKALVIEQQSHGYFDASLSPLIELWGFGVQGEPPREPSQESLRHMLNEQQGARVSVAERQLCKNIDNLQVNYSAIAKGYAVDQVAELLKEAGYKNFLVEVGGELYGLGSKLTGEAWKIGIEKPSYGFNQALYSTLELSDKAVATSGDYRNYYEVDSVRYSHILNPKTGRPVQHSAASVTVIHDSAMVADGWATALLAAGPETGMQLADELKLKVLMILHDGDGFKELVSTEWLEMFAGLNNQSNKNK